MPEYDAFGREIGEDPLAAFREATNPAPPRPETPRAEPAGGESASPRAETVAAGDADALAAWSGPRGGAAAPEAAGGAAPSERVSPPPPRLSRPRRTIVRRRRGGLAGLIVVAIVLAGVGLVANSAVEQGRDIIRRIQPPLAEPAPTGLQARSLVRAENFRNALDTLAGAGLGRPTSIRIAPERVDAELIKDGQVHNVQITPDGRLKDFGSGPGIGTPFAFKAIDPTAPERLVRRGANRAHPARTINYVLITPGSPLTVAAYFNGRIVIGDRHGRPQRVIG